MDALELMLLLPTGASKRLTQSQRKGGSKERSPSPPIAPHSQYEEKERERVSGECPRALPERNVDTKAVFGLPK